MSASHAAAGFRAFIASLPRIAVRDRRSDNQMVMFTVFSVAALAVMMLLPSPRAAFGAVDKNGIAGIAQADKAGRLPAMTDADRACAGQVWGIESLDCILAIARDAGQARTVRLADAELRH